ncbi:MAG: ABC transporter ATP-binding protein [Alphaproteobacteria bacterium]|nr:ABC transporter ATP-binding protein [Alphaproteobacteria bacterium]
MNVAITMNIQAASETPTAPKAGERKRDRALYQRLIESYRADRIGIFVDFGRLNHPKSPVFSPWENVAPILVVVGGSIAMMFTLDLLIGTALLVAGIFVYLLAIRPWIAQRVYRRSLDAATDTLRNWNILWRLGGLVVTLNYMNKTRCVSPDGDWRAFVTRYLPEAEVEGLESLEQFSKTNKQAGEKEGTRIADVEM